MGSCGDYEEHTLWPVAALDSPEEASRFVAEADGLALALYQQYQRWQDRLRKLEDTLEAYQKLYGCSPSGPKADLSGLGRDRTSYQVEKVDYWTVA